MKKCALPILLVLLGLSIDTNALDKVTPKALKATEAKIQSLASKNSPAVVSLIPGGNAAHFGTGSGVVVDEKGLILTAAHVAVEMDEEVIVIFPNGDRAPGKVLGMDFDRDAAMIQITREGKYPFVELAKTDPLETNEWCVALGHPGGFDADRSPPLRLGRVIEQNEDGFLVTDSALYGGDSGGPLFDVEGKLIAIHSNIGWSLLQNRHVPISVFIENWDRLKNSERYGGDHIGGFLTNPYRPMIGAVLEDARGDRGVVVWEVAPDSPAMKAGLVPGDIVTAAGGGKVKNTEEMLLAISKTKPGESIEFMVTRENGEEKMEVKPVEANELNGFARLRSPGPQIKRNKPEEPPAPKSEEEMAALQKKFNKRMKDAMKEGQLDLEESEIEEYGGFRAYGDLLRGFVASLSEEEAEKLFKLMSVTEPEEPEAFDPDAEIPVGEDFFREVLDAFHPSVKRASDSVHLVFRGTEWKSLCTVVSEDGLAVTKESEIETKNNQALNVMIAKGKLVPAEVVKTYHDYDMALIRLKTDVPLVPCSIAKEKTLPLGSVIAAPGSGPDPLAVGLISVLSRSLSGKNKGFLGIGTAPHQKGVRITQILPDSAADHSGLRSGDVILSVDGNVTNTPEKLIKAVSSVRPGESIDLEINRGKESVNVPVELGDRGEYDARFRDPNTQMNRYGTEVNKVRTGFPNVIQTDLPIEPRYCGGPVVNLDGEVIGINIARAGRVMTYTIPVSVVYKLIAPELEKAKAKKGSEKAERTPV